jgi:hypothetical protein
MTINLGNFYKNNILVHTFPQKDLDRMTLFNLVYNHEQYV